MCILTFKNTVAKEYYKSIGIYDFIDRKSMKFNSVIDMIVRYKQKGGYSITKINAINKNISKFCEFIYYLLCNDSQEIVEFKQNQKNFSILRDKIDEHKTSSLNILEKDFEVLNWIKKIFKMTEEEFTI